MRKKIITKGEHILSTLIPKKFLNKKPRSLTKLSKNLQEDSLATLYHHMTRKAVYALL